MTPQKFRVKESVDLSSPLNRWLTRFCEAVQVSEDNTAEVIEWCSGARAFRPGALVALQGWTCTWQTAGPGDWIVLPEGRTFRIIQANSFEQNYEPV